MFLIFNEKINRAIKFGIILKIKQKQLKLIKVKVKNWEHRKKIFVYGKNLKDNGAFTCFLSANQCGAFKIQAVVTLQHNDSPKYTREMTLFDRKQVKILKFFLFLKKTYKNKFFWNLLDF